MFRVIKKNCILLLCKREILRIYNKKIYLLSFSSLHLKSVVVLYYFLTKWYQSIGRSRGANDGEEEKDKKKEGKEKEVKKMLSSLIIKKNWLLWF